MKPPYPLPLLLLVLPASSASTSTWGSSSTITPNNMEDSPPTNITWTLVAKNNDTPNNNVDNDVEVNIMDGYCGLSWIDANTNCPLACPNGENSECSTLGEDYTCQSYTLCEERIQGGDFVVPNAPEDGDSPSLIINNPTESLPSNGIPSDGDVIVESDQSIPNASENVEGEPLIFTTDPPSYGITNDSDGDGDDVSTASGENIPIEPENGHATTSTDAPGISNDYTQKFCGRTWTDAYENCLLACPDGNNAVCRSLGEDYTCQYYTLCDERIQSGDIIIPTTPENGESDSGMISDTTPTTSQTSSTQSPFTPTAEPPGDANKFCGRTWIDAYENCPLACPDGDDTICSLALGEEYSCQSFTLCGERIQSGEIIIPNTPEDGDGSVGTMSNITSYSPSIRPTFTPTAEPTDPSEAALISYPECPGEYSRGANYTVGSLVSKSFPGNSTSAGEKEVYSCLGDDCNAGLIASRIPGSDDDDAHSSWVLVGSCGSSVADASSSTQPTTQGYVTTVASAAAAAVSSTLSASFETSSSTLDSFQLTPTAKPTDLSGAAMISFPECPEDYSPGDTYTFGSIVAYSSIPNNNNSTNEKEVHSCRSDDCNAGMSQTAGTDDAHSSWMLVGLCNSGSSTVDSSSTQPTMTQGYVTTMESSSDTNFSTAATTSPSDDARWWLKNNEAGIAEECVYGEGYREQFEEESMENYVFESEEECCTFYPGACSGMVPTPTPQITTNSPTMESTDETYMPTYMPITDNASFHGQRFTFRIMTIFVVLIF